MAEDIIDVEKIIDNSPWRGFHGLIVVMCFLLMLIDGFDITVAAFAGPGLVRQFHVSPTALGALFSAALVAGLIGTPLFGILADWLGRKRIIVAGTMFFGLFTLAAVVAPSFKAMIVLRFLAGIGVAGVMPTTVALVSEFAPRRFRATMVTLMFAGSPLGGVATGLVAAGFVPSFGWQILFWVAGLGPIVLAVVLAAALPESIHHLVLRPRARDRLIRTVRRLAPTLRVDDQTRFVARSHGPARAMKTSALFAGRLAWLTPLIWGANFLSLIVFYFAGSWLPTLLAHSAAGPNGAALASSLYMLGGAVGGLAIMWPLDRVGFLPVPVLFFCAIPALIAVGLPGLTVPGLLIAIPTLGFCLYGLQSGLIAMEGPLFPPPVRGRGVGFCFAAARVGATIGPMAAGVLIGARLPTQSLFMLFAIPLGLGGVVAAIITPLYRRQVLDAGRLAPGFSEAPGAMGMSVSTDGV